MLVWYWTQCSSTVQSLSWPLHPLPHHINGRLLHCTGPLSCSAEMSNINSTSEGNWAANLQWQSWEAELTTSIVCARVGHLHALVRERAMKGGIERAIVLWSLYHTYWFIWTEVLAVRPPMTSTCSSGTAIITLQHHKSLWLLPQWNRRQWVSHCCLLNVTKSLIVDENVTPRNLFVIWKLPFPFLATIGVICVHMCPL